MNNQTFAIISIALIGIGCANIFPLIFSITVNSMPERTNEISGLMVTAIFGGAIVPLTMARVMDMALKYNLSISTSVTLGFLIPLACTLYLLCISFVSPKHQAAD